MNLLLHSRPLAGTLPARASKSVGHRALICAALSRAPSHLLLNATSDDLLATVRALTALGASFVQTPDGFDVDPISEPPAEASLDCGESGSTLRFLMPVCAALGVHARFLCHGRLGERPIVPLSRALAAHGICFPDTHEICGRLTPGDFVLPGDVSSQYVTALLYATSLLSGDSRILLSSALESASYVRLTLDVLRRAGARIDECGEGFCVHGIGRFSSPDFSAVEGDYSNAAFPLAAGVRVTGLSPDSLQGDRAILSVLRQMGATVHEEDGVRAEYTSLSPITLDVSDIPDLVPPIAVLCAAAKGKSHIVGAARLRLKESDRIRTVCALLSALGVRVTEGEADITIHGDGTLHGGVVDAAGDHRIAMAAATASHFADGDITVLGAEAVDKSYPRFWEDFSSLGGAYTILTPHS